MKKIASILCLLATPAYAQMPPTNPTPAAPVPVSVAAQKVEKTELNLKQYLDTARTQYDNKEYGKAAKTLKDATEALYKQKTSTLEPFLPEAPKGWTAQDFGADFSLGDGASASRVYTSGSEQVTLTITADSRMGAGMRELEMGKTTLQLMGYPYSFKAKDPKQNYSIGQGNLFVNDTLQIKVLGNNLTDKQSQGFIGLIDIKKLIAVAEK